MSTPPDPNELARRLIDLWEDQLRLNARDPALGEMMQAWTRLFGAGQMASEASASAGDDGLQPGYAPVDKRPVRAREQQSSEDGNDSSEQRQRPDGTKTSSDVSGDGDGNLALILSKLQRIEERLARLEAGAERRGELAEVSDGRDDALDAGWDDLPGRLN